MEIVLRIPGHMDRLMPLMDHWFHRGEVLVPVYDRHLTHSLGYVTMEVDSHGPSSMSFMAYVARPTGTEVRADGRMVPLWEAKERPRKVAASARPPRAVILREETR